MRIILAQTMALIKMIFFMSISLLDRDYVTASEHFPFTESKVRRILSIKDSSKSNIQIQADTISGFLETTQCHKLLDGVSSELQVRIAI